MNMFLISLGLTSLTLSFLLEGTFALVALIIAAVLFALAAVVSYPR